VFNELVDAEVSGVPGFDPAYMLDQSHNVTDPLESLVASAVEVVRAYAQALLVDRPALEAHQEANDAMMALQTLKRAFTTDVAPILAMARLRAGGAIDPLQTYRASRYRAAKAAERGTTTAAGAGIVCRLRAPAPHAGLDSRGARLVDDVCTSIASMHEPVPSWTAWPQFGAWSPEPECSPPTLPSTSAPAAGVPSSVTCVRIGSSATRCTASPTTPAWSVGTCAGTSRGSSPDSTRASRVRQPTRAHAAGR
jgi:hypothetical protein